MILLRRLGPLTRGRTFALCALALVFAIFLAVFWRVLFLGETFGDRDLAAYYHPSKSILAPLARASGGIPLWNPFFASGQPLAANPEHGFFFPLTTLFLLLPFELAFGLQVMLPLLLSGAAMFVLLRTLGRSRPAALFGALAWAFGGYTLSNTNLLPILFALVPLPLVLTFVIRLARRPRFVEMAGLSLSFGVQCLAAEPSTLFATLALSLMAFLSQARPELRKRGAALVLALALGGAVGAVALLPGLHHAGKTPRASGLQAEQALEWSMPPIRALDFVGSGALGQVETGRPDLFWGSALYGKRASPYFFSLYPGVGVALLALMAVGMRRRRLWAWGAAAGLGFLVALGSHFPLWPTLRHLPGLWSLRFPEKFILVTVVPLVILASVGFDQVVLGSGRARRRFMMAMGGLMLLAVLVGALVRLGALPLPVAISRSDLGWSSFRVALLAGAAVSLIRWIPARHMRAMSLCALLAVDLASAAPSVVHTVPPARMTNLPRVLLPVAQSQRDHLLFHEAEWHDSLGSAAGLSKPPIPAQWGLATTLENDFDLTFTSATDRGTKLFWQVVRLRPELKAPLLERRGVTSILRFRPGSTWREGTVQGPDGKGALELLQSQQSQPMFFAASRVEIVDGDLGWLQAVGRLGFEVRHTAIVDRANLASFPATPAPAEIQVRERTPMSARLEVVGHGPGPSFVAVNQTWDEGWRARMDGVPAPWLLTDISLSGIIVPPGPHHIELEYRDRWVTAGLGITAFSTLALLVLMLVARRRTD